MNISIDSDVTGHRVDVHAAAGRLQALRLDKGWPVTTLADLAGVPESVVRRAEKGSFSLINVKKINDALGGNLSRVLFGDGETP